MRLIHNAPNLFHMFSGIRPLPNHVKAKKRGGITAYTPALTPAAVH